MPGFLANSIHHSTTSLVEFLVHESVGLSLSYGLSLNATLFWAIRVSCFAENRMVSVERVKQFTNIPSEAAWKIKDCLPSPKWPTRGDVQLKDLKVRYHPNTPLILKGITLSIHEGEKIGIVGISVVMTTTSTISAVVMTPFLTSKLAGLFVAVDPVGLFASTLDLDAKQRFLLHNNLM